MLCHARLLTIVVALACSAGCAHRAPHGAQATSRGVLECRQVERLPLIADVSNVPVLNSLPPAEPTRFCALAERSAQCLAANNATQANVLNLEAEAILAGSGPLREHLAGSSLVAQLMRIEAVDKRNSAAADSLQAFLRLVEAEAGSDNLERRGREIDRTLAEMGQLQDRGMLAPVPKAEVEGQRLELWRRQGELRATIAQLNGQVEQLIGLPLAPGARFWPESSLAVSAEAPDPEVAVGIALANRADLAALRVAASTEGSEAMAADRAILQLAGAGLGGSPARHACWLPHVRAADEESAARHRQVVELLSQRQRAVAQETRLAAMLVATRLVQIGLTRRRLEIAREHSQAMEQQHRLTEGPQIKVRQARLDELAVEQDLLHDVIEWKLAVVKLKQAEGMLAIECGFSAAQCGEARCSCR
jgi:hypothetical protein